MWRDIHICRWKAEFATTVVAVDDRALKPERTSEGFGSSRNVSGDE
jgi:hypothetical protein